MIHKPDNSISSFIAGDLTVLKEVLHPKNDNIPLNYSIARASIAVEAASLPHSLKSSEVYYILEGQGKIVIGKETKDIAKGDVIYVPPSESQYVINTGKQKLEFLCIVSPAWSAEEEIIF